MGNFFTSNKFEENSIENIKHDIHKYIKILFDEKGNWNPNYEKNSKILLTMMDPKVCESVVFMFSNQLNKLPYEEIINEGRVYNTKTKMSIISKTDDYFISKKKEDEKKRMCNKIGLRWTRIFNILVAIALTTIYTDKRSKSQNFCETRFKSLFDLEKNESSICDDKVIYDNFYYISGLDAIVSLFDKFGLNTDLNKKLFTKDHINIDENTYFLKFINEIKNLFKDDFCFTNNTYNINTNYIGGGGFLDNKFNLNELFKTKKNDEIDSTNKTLYELFKTKKSKIDNSIRSASKKNINIPINYKTKKIKERCKLLLNDEVLRKKNSEYKLRFDTELLDHNTFKKFKNSIIKMKKEYKNELNKLLGIVKKLISVEGNPKLRNLYKGSKLVYRLNHITDSELAKITKDTKMSIINLIKICESGYRKNLILLLNSYEEYLLRLRNPPRKKRFYFF